MNEELVKCEGEPKTTVKCVLSEAKNALLEATCMGAVMLNNIQGCDWNEPKVQEPTCLMDEANDIHALAFSALDLLRQIKSSLY